MNDDLSHSQSSHCSVRSAPHKPYSPVLSTSTFKTSPTTNRPSALSVYKFLPISGASAHDLQLAIPFSSISSTITLRICPTFAFRFAAFAWFGFGVRHSVFHVPLHSIWDKTSKNRGIGALIQVNRCDGWSFDNLADRVSINSSNDCRRTGCVSLYLLPRCCPWVHMPKK